MFSVMEKLPATSYVRLVDIWLIFCQVMPFIQGKIKNTVIVKNYAPDLGSSVNPEGVV